MEDKILKHAFANAAEHGGKADVNAVLGRVLAENADMRKDVKSALEQVRKAVEHVNSLPLEEQKSHVRPAAKKHPETGLPELPNAEKVVMRLAPFPSGPLHIGNARMVILNDEYVKRYKGRLLLVFDDTIGSEEKAVLPGGYELIKDGLDWLGVKYNQTIYKSDRIPIFYDYAGEMIEKGLFYVCTCSEKEFRENREKGIDCPCRGHTYGENALLWKKMLDGTIKPGGAAVRLKTSMQNPNPAFRDRVMLRISDRKHPRVGNKYRVWPTLEFSWAIDDHLLGVTHILRGKQLVIEDMVEKFIWDAMKWDKPAFVHYGMLKVKEGKLSKSQTRALIKQKRLSGWDDPRTWSLQSLRARGIQPMAVRKFVLALGLSEADVDIPDELLYAENRKIIDRIANRYFAVKPLEISVEGAPPIKKAKALLHPDFPKRGKRSIPINAKHVYIDSGDAKLFGKNVGMINLFTVNLGKRSKFVSEKINYEDPKIQWVSKPNVKIRILMTDGSMLQAIAEPDLKKVEDGSIIQFYRIGFCKIKKKGGIVARFSHK